MSLDRRELHGVGQQVRHDLLQPRPVAGDHCWFEVETQRELLLFDRLLHSMAVGATHWERAGAGEGELPGPAPSFFFAPDRVVKRSEDWGRAGLESRVADAWHPFCGWTSGWLEPIPDTGFEGVERAWLEVLDGGVPPDRAHVLTLAG